MTDAFGTRLFAATLLLALSTTFSLAEQVGALRPETRQGQRLQIERDAQAALRAQIERMRGGRSLLTVATEQDTTSRAGSDQQFTINQTSTGPLAPPAPVFDGIELIDAMMIGVTTLDNKNILGIGPLDFYVEQQEQETIKFKESLKEVARAIYGDTIETEDDPLNLVVKFLHGNGTSPSPESQPRGPLGKNVMFAASFATSIFGGTDSALLLAAAEVKLNPAKMVWHKFRVQLTKVHAPVNFCTPSTTASVLSNFRMSASLSGRLFIAFDSFENSTTTGSILDIDVASLLAGETPKLKCFTGPQYARLTSPDVRDTNAKAYFVGIKDLATVKRFVLTARATVANDTLAAASDIAIPSFDFNPAAVQPNGFHLYDGGFEFRLPSIQIGSNVWNAHVVGDGNGHSKVRLYKFGTKGTAPKMTLTLSTRSDQADDLFAPSFDVDATKAYVTFSRTISNNAKIGNATLMMAKGPSGSASHWTSRVLAKSAGQISKDMFGNPCDSFEFAGCDFGPNSGTLHDPLTHKVWGVGEIITAGQLGTGGAGNEVNWRVRGISVPQ